VGLLATPPETAEPSATPALADVPGLTGVTLGPVTVVPPFVASVEPTGRVGVSRVTDGVLAVVTAVLPPGAAGILAMPVGTVDGFTAGFVPAGIFATVPLLVGGGATRAMPVGTAVGFIAGVVVFVAVVAVLLGVTEVLLGVPGAAFATVGEVAAGLTAVVGAVVADFVVTGFFVDFLLVSTAAGFGFTGAPSSSMAGVPAHADATMKLNSATVASEA
jgi:hypothetical protein